MNTYKYIWNPIKKRNININSKEGLNMLKIYITTLKGGNPEVLENPLNKRIEFVPNPLAKRLNKKPKARCYNYFISKKSGGKTKKKYIKKYTSPACPDSLLKHDNGTLITDKFGNWYPEDWNIDNPQSMKSIMNKDYKCNKKNKKKCKEIYNKSKKCTGCLDNKIDNLKVKIRTGESSKAGIKSMKKIIKKVSKMKNYLENINDKNKAMLNN